MAIDVTSQIDQSALADGQNADAADVTTPFNNTITLWNAWLNGTQSAEKSRYDQLSGAPSAPATDKWLIYFLADGMYYLDDAGTPIGPLGAAVSVDAGDVTYTPTTLTDWDTDADPGDLDAALDQLAERVDNLENSGGGAVDASGVTYTPTTAADWDGAADPGDVDNALDQLAERVADIEGGGSNVPDYILIQDRKAQNTAGGSFSSGAWRTRDLNTIAADDGTRASITLLAFTSGGTYEVVVGDTITGATSTETATVFDVEVTSGTWAGGDAAGNLYLNDQSGAFGAENLNVGANPNVATIAGDSVNNIIRLKAGTYQCEIRAPAFSLAGHQARLYNVTDAGEQSDVNSNTMYGSVAYSHASSPSLSHSIVKGRFTLAASKTLRVEHRSTNTKTTNGFGDPCNFGPEIYTVVEIQKVA